MALRSRYRERPVEQPSNIPEPSEKINVEVRDAAVPDVAAIEPPQPDEATLTLQKQIADLKKSEQMQRDYAERMALMAQQQQHAQRPPSREEKVSAWRANGGDEGDISFLESNPEMIDRHDVTVVAAEEAARQGHQRGTEAHRLATRENFHRHLGHQQARPAAPAEPAPAFFAPEAERVSHSAPDSASIYSAPVSRATQSASTGQRPARTVRLTAEEQEYARVAGITDVEYARLKQRLAQAKANGDYGERR